MIINICVFSLHVHQSGKTTSCLDSKLNDKKTVNMKLD